MYEHRSAQNSLRWAERGYKLLSGSLVVRKQSDLQTKLYYNTLWGMHYIKSNSV